MKFPLVILSALLIIGFAHCKAKQKTVQTGPPAPPPLPSASGKNESEMQIQIAQLRWPNTVVEELNEGNTIYRTKCTKCHENFAVDTFSEKKWLHEIDDMSPKARLSPEEKLKLTKYLLSYRDTKEKLNGR